MIGTGPSLVSSCSVPSRAARVPNTAELPRRLAAVDVSPGEWPRNTQLLVG